MSFITVFIILLFIYMVVGLMDHLLSIYQFFKPDEDDYEEDDKDEKKKKKLEE